MGQVWAALVLALALQTGTGQPDPSGAQPGPKLPLTDPAGKQVQGDRTPLDSVQNSLGEMAGQLDEVQHRAAELEHSEVPAENPNKELIQRVRHKLKRLSALLEERRRRRATRPEQARSVAPESDASATPSAQEDASSHEVDADRSKGEQEAETIGSADRSPERARPVTARPPITERQPEPSDGAHQDEEEDDPESIPLLDGPVDPLRAARACLRSGRYQDALRYYRVIDSEQLPADERHWVLYEQAMCWKMVGDYDRAQQLYREVARRAADMKLREACQWQLESLKWRRQTDNLVRQLESAMQPSPGS